MSINLINLKHISAKDFYSKISKKKCKTYRNVVDLLAKGIEICEIIDSNECLKVLYYLPNGDICVENEKFTQEKEGIPLYDLQAYYNNNTLLVDLINKKNNNLWKKIKFPTMLSAKKFTEVFNDLVEEYLKYSEIPTVNYKYLKLS
tara:strand:- start:1462 stop:1899 length:438 start_codon:yes stop_codon:yes gene_type:complete